MKGKREAAGGEGRRKAALGREDEGGKDEHVQSNRKGSVNIKHTSTAMGPAQLLPSKRRKLVSGWGGVSAGGCCMLMRTSHGGWARDGGFPSQSRCPGSTAGGNERQQYFMAEFGPRLRCFISAWWRDVEVSSGSPLLMSRAAPVKSHPGGSLYLHRCAVIASEKNNSQEVFVCDPLEHK